MKQFLIHCFLASLLSLGVSGAHAADINVDAKVFASLTPNFPIQMVKIHIRGPFIQGDSDKLRKILTRLKAKPAAFPEAPLATVELSSSGGDLNEGMRMGYLFREFDVATVVRKGDICLSACALAFLGGTSYRDSSDAAASLSLEIGGRLGFHNFSLTPDSVKQQTPKNPVQGRLQGFEEARAGAATVMRYAADLGIAPHFVALLLTMPPEEFAYVNTTEEFLNLRVCPIGLGRPSISPAEQALNICNHSIDGPDPATPSQIITITQSEAKRHLLDKLQQSMLSFKMKGVLSDQLANESVIRNDQAVDDLYADLLVAGVALPEITGPVFEVGGYQKGTSKMQCFVSLSINSPDRYDVVIGGANGMVRANRSAPKDCRRLFLHSKDAVINPHL